MGIFLNIAGLQTESDITEDIISLKEKYEWFGECYIVKKKNGVMVMQESTYSSECYIICEELSEKLNCTACHFSISDGDQWGYELFHKGKIVDEFFQRPEIIDGLEKKKIPSLFGKPKIFVKYWENIELSKVEKYIIPNSKLSFLKRRKKAYNHDEFTYNNCWQLTDFLREIGLPYEE